MINHLQLAFEHLSIRNYRIINHQIEHNIYTAANGSSNISLQTRNVSMTTAFFVFDGCIYKIELFGRDSSICLEAMLHELISKRQYYGLVKDDVYLGEELEKYIKRPYDPNENDTLNNISLMNINEKVINDMLSTSQALSFSKIRIDRILCYTSVHFRQNVVQRYYGNIRGAATVQFSPELPICEINFSGSSKDELVRSLVASAHAAENTFKMGIPGSIPEEYSGICIFSARLVKTLFSFLCLSMVGQCIVSGTSFLRPSDFQTRLFSENISFLRRADNAIQIDAEGSIRDTKFYIQDGVLLEAFNDILSATELGQQAGDMEIDYVHLSYEVSLADLCVSVPRREISNVPTFTDWLGNYVYFNQMTGDISFSAIGSDARGNCKHINYKGKLVDLINRIIGSCSNGILVDHMMVADMVLEL